MGCIIWMIFVMYSKWITKKSIGLTKSYKDTVSIEQYLFLWKTSKYFDENNPKIFIFTFISNHDSLDWKDYGVDSIIKTVTKHKHLGNGSIILCHNGAKYTAQALENMIVTLKESGYTFVPLSELIYKEDFYMNHEGRQCVK